MVPQITLLRRAHHYSSSTAHTSGQYSTSPDLLQNNAIWIFLNHPVSLATANVNTHSRVPKILSTGFFSQRITERLTASRSSPILLLNTCRGRQCNIYPECSEVGSYGRLVFAGMGDCLDRGRVHLRAEGRDCRGCCGSRSAETGAWGRDSRDCLCGVCGVGFHVAHSFV